MPKMPLAASTCPCIREGLDSRCFSDLHERGEACLCVEEALIIDAMALGATPGPLPS